MGPSETPPPAVAPEVDLASVDQTSIDHPPPPAARGNRSSLRTWLAATAVTAVVALGVGFMLSRSSGTSSAATTTASSSDAQGAAFPGGARRGTRGTVTKLDGADISVQTADQSGTTSTVVVRTSAATTYTTSVTGALSDLKVGDNVVVNGESSNGSVAATAINDNGDTTFGRGANRTGGQPPADFSGAPPEGFSGAPPNDGSFPTPPSGAQTPSGNVTIGKITAIDGTTLTVSSFNGDAVTVTTSASTTVTVMKSATLADIKVGDTISATGETSDGVVTATNVRIGDAGFAPGGFPGGFRGNGGPGVDPNASVQSGN